MIKSSIEKLSDSIGFEIGTSDDITQANLLNGFCKGLSNSILQKSDMEMQMCYIADKLNDTTENVLIGLVEFIKLKNENI
jgi:hypothetical protein